MPEEGNFIQHMQEHTGEDKLYQNQTLKDQPFFYIANLLHSISLENHSTHD